MEPIEIYLLADLEGEFTKFEILQDVDLLEMDKTPELNGFTAEVFKNVEHAPTRYYESVSRLFSLFRMGLLTLALMRQIYLLPRKIDAKPVVDFRPIALQDSYQSISKRYFPLTITNNQTTFVEGRQNVMLL